MKITKSQSGLSLIEILISLSITITITGLLTNFLYNFNKNSIVNSKRSELASELRTANLRLQKEIEAGAKVLSSIPNIDPTTGSAYVTNKDTLILARPVFNKNTFLPLTYESPVNNSDMINNFSYRYDKVIIKYHRGNVNNLQGKKLTFTVIPASQNVTSDYIISSPIPSQTIAYNLSNYTDENKATVTDPFQYYIDSNSLPVTDKYYKITLIGVNLFGRNSYGNRVLRDNLFTKVTLRNYISNKGVN